MIETESPPISDDDENKLWCRCSDLNDSEARNELIHLYLPYARMLAAMLYAKRPNNVIEFNEYLQYANVGLIEAVDRYKPQLDIKFKTFSSYRIKGAILNGLAKSTELNEQVACKKRLQRERVKSLLDDSDSTQDKGAFEELVDVAIGLALVYMLDDTELVNDPSGVNIAEPYSNYEMSQLSNRLKSVLDQIPEREAMIIRYHYYHQMGFDELSQIMGISKGRVSQLHKRALTYLREGVSEKSTFDTSY